MLPTKPKLDIADLCNAAVQDAIENPQAEPTKQVRPIMAMQCVGNEVSLRAEIIQHRSRAVLLSNGTCQFWCPRSQVRRVQGTMIYVTQWIAYRKSAHLQFFPNQSPQYTEWLAAEEKRKKHEEMYPMKPMEWKFDNGKVG